MSSIRKITLFLIGTISLMLLFFGGSVYYFQYQYSYTDFYKRLETRVRVAEKYYFDQNETNAQVLKKLRHEQLEKLSEEREYIIPIVNAEELNNIAIEKALPLGFIKSVYSKNTAKYQTEDVFYYGARFDKTNATYLILISAKNYYASHHLLLLRNVLIGSGLISIFIIIYLSYFFFKKDI
ncbi:MAG: hypothetical protein IPG85_15375 [Bacteroidetes bacterium]|nr:hypothetical protein [Bacteroidota bacterium]